MTTNKTLLAGNWVETSPATETLSPRNMNPRGFRQPARWRRTRDRIAGVFGGRLAALGALALLLPSAGVRAAFTESKLAASAGAAFDQFGSSMAMSADGETVIVGAGYAGFGKGAAYVDRWNGNQWAESKLTAGDGGASDQFGHSVAISGDGDTVIVGAPGNDSYKGAAYVYSWNGSQWVGSKLTAGDGVGGDEFGISVAMSADGNTVIVGAYDAGSTIGAAYVYDSNGSGWIETKLTASDGVAKDHFGNSVAMSADGNTVIVGAFRKASYKGAAYVYGRNGSQWVETELTPGDGVEGDTFGWSVAMSGDGRTVGVGASGADSYKGAIYVYGWDGSQWVGSKLSASDGVANDQFGWSVALSGDGRAVGVGADGAGMARGAAYVYREPECETPVVSLTNPASGAILSVNTGITFTGSFTGDSGPHTAQWLIGDYALEGTVDEMAHAVSDTFSFDAAGVYPVRLTVTNGCGNSGTINAVGDLPAYVVIFDPSAGFVTGGGWINSPAGAYVVDPSLSGKASFGFVARYQKGATVPTGTTQFEFKAGELNFGSTSYQWLVVAGARAQFKGEGAINGVSGYGFLLTAVDGQISGGGGTDKFRIKIWNIVTGSMVYDNGLGVSDDSDPEALGGGSIIIHN